MLLGVDKESNLILSENANHIDFISTTENFDTSTPMGMMVLTILASVSQNERDVGVERVCMVMNELAKGCVHMGGTPPFGYRVDSDRHYVIEPREAQAARFLICI